MSAFDISALQSSINLSTDPEQIRANRDQIRAAVAALGAQRKMVDALSAANEQMCSHEDKYSSNWCGRDPGGGGCNTCGKSW
jgi:hypothetical protein